MLSKLPPAPFCFYPFYETSRVIEMLQHMAGGLHRGMRNRSSMSRGTWLLISLNALLLQPWSFQL